MYGERTLDLERSGTTGCVAPPAGCVRSASASGDVVAFLDKNHPACVEITLAAGSLGRRPRDRELALGGDEVDYAVNDSRRQGALRRHGAGADDRRRSATASPTSRRSSTVTPDGARGRRVRSVAGRLGARWSARTTTSPDDVCLVMYSSGTTGRPKGVMLTHANMIEHTDNAHEGWGFEDGDKSLVAMPLFHVGGSSYILFTIFDGVPSVMTRDPDGASLAWAIMNGANRTFLVPGGAGPGAPERG